MEGEKCKNCGESAVVADEGQVVCTNCGQVQEDATVFVTEGDFHEHSQSCHAGGSFNPTFGKQDYRLANSNTYYRSVLHKWTKYIQKLCESMQIANKQMHIEAGDIFKRAFKISRFKNMMKERKKAMCVSCVYITCRLHEWPIMIINLVGITDTPRELLMTINRELIQELKIKIDTVSIEDYIPTCLKENGVTDDRWTAKTLEVMSLAKELWLTIGRHIDALILASCCIAWQTSTPENHKKSIPQFGRSLLNRKVPDLAKKRHKELTNIIKKMVSKVPWVSKTILSKSWSWMFFLDDILKYKNSLLSHLAPPEDCDGIDDIENQENDFILLPPAYEASVRKRKFEKPSIEEEDFTVKSGHETSESMNNPELSEKDIPDSELGHYIRTPKEIQLVKELAVIADINYENS